MGTATKPAVWAKTTKREWTDDIIQLVDVIGIADGDVGLLVDEDGNIEVDDDVVRVCEQAASIQRKKFAIILREYGRAYCEEQGDGHNGSKKDQAAFVGEHIESIIDLTDEADKRKPVTDALVNFAESFGDRFGK